MVASRRKNIVRPALAPLATLAPEAGKVARSTAGSSGREQPLQFFHCPRRRCARHISYAGKLLARARNSLHPFWDLAYGWVAVSAARSCAGLLRRRRTPLPAARRDRITTATIFNGRVASENSRRRRSISSFCTPLRRRMRGAVRNASDTRLVANREPSVQT